MATFTYSARTATGDLQAGELALKTREEVVQYLRRQRMVPIKIEQKQQSFTMPTIGRGFSVRSRGSFDTRSSGRSMSVAATCSCSHS